MAVRAPIQSAISPTAHFTGHVWLRHGLSRPEFFTREGAVMFRLLSPVDRVGRWVIGAAVEDMLLARHRGIDECLHRAIEAGHVSQVVELAAGLSPRGQRFMARHQGSGLVYVEADLQTMANRKRELLDRTGLRARRHHVVTVDALADDGEGCLDEAVSGLLDPDRGTALITEGLVGYFSRDVVAGMWARFGQFLRRYPRGLYLSDLNLDADVARLRGGRAVRDLLARLAADRRIRPFRDVPEATTALGQAGFGRVAMPLAGQRYTAGARASAYVRVVEAWTDPA